LFEVAHIGAVVRRERLIRAGDRAISSADRNAAPVANSASPTASRISLRSAPPVRLALRRRRPASVLHNRALARLRTSALLIASAYRLECRFEGDARITSTAHATSPPRGHRFSLLIVNQLRSPVHRPAQSHRSDRRNEIVIEGHITDRVVQFCDLRDEGKIKGLIHVPRI
jgi:hypothetical protein